MTTVHHPKFPEITHDVPTKDVPEWVAQGWLKPEPAKSVRKRK